MDQHTEKEQGGNHYCGPIPVHAQSTAAANRKKRPIQPPLVTVVCEKRTGQYGHSDQPMQAVRDSPRTIVREQHPANHR